jgi:hypothetical protein
MKGYNPVQTKSLFFWRSWRFLESGLLLISFCVYFLGGIKTDSSKWALTFACMFGHALCFTSNTGVITDILFVSNLHKFFLSWRCLIKTKGTFCSYFFIHLATSSLQMNPYDHEVLLDGEWICYDYCENTLKLDRKFLLLLYNMSTVACLWKEDPPQNWKSQLLCQLTLSFSLVSDVMPLILIKGQIHIMWSS